jgi:hypothetical protein
MSDVKRSFTTRDIRLRRAIPQDRHLMPPRPIHESYGLLTCDWQGCDDRAIAFRDSPWGDLAVCERHLSTPLGTK